jgi:SAM-dependent methyltransferase
MTALPEADRERLRQHFLSGNTPDRWEKLWQNSFMPWDRGAPNPALLDIINNHKDLFGTSEGSGGTKKRALVPGCGRGYDVMLLASFGYDAVGVDGSETAIKAAETLPQEHMDKYPLQPGVQERGKVAYVLGDFFSKSWEGTGGFDIIYDYTVSYNSLQGLELNAAVLVCSPS